MAGSLSSSWRGGLARRSTLRPTRSVDTPAARTTGRYPRQWSGRLWLGCGSVDLAHDCLGDAGGVWGAVVPTKNSILTETTSSEHPYFPSLLMGFRPTLGNGIVLTANKSLHSESLTSTSGSSHRSISIEWY